MVLVIFVVGAPASAQENRSDLVRAAVAITPPFVLQQDGALTGFSVDLWNAVAERINVRTSYETLPRIEDLDAALRSGKADAVVVPQIMTLSRVKEFDLSVPTLQVGQQIMVPGREEATSRGKRLWTEFGLLFSRTTFIWLGIALILVLVPAHLVWFLERREGEGIVSNPRYIPGIFQAIYWALACLATQAEKMPHHWLARVVAVFWMFTGVAFVASYTAQLTSKLTVQQIRGTIRGPRDLPGKSVGTIVGSFVSEYLAEHDVRVRTFQRPDEMFQALVNGNLDAVVWDALVLNYYVEHEGRGRVRLVGPEFQFEPAAILFPLNSPLRRKVDIAILALQADGTYQRLRRKWLGNSM